MTCFHDEHTTRFRFSACHNVTIRIPTEAEYRKQGNLRGKIEEARKAIAKEEKAINDHNGLLAQLELASAKKEVL